MFRTICILLFLLFGIGITSSQIHYRETGEARLLNDSLMFGITHSGLAFENDAMVASHLTLPFGSVLKVSNPDKNRSIMVKVVHRGPFDIDAVVGLSDSAWNVLELQPGQHVITQYMGLGDMPADTEISGPEFYHTDAQVVKPRGYGIQIGSYNSKENLLKAIETAGMQLDEQIIIQVIPREGHYIYRVMAGDFIEKDDATSWHESIKVLYPDSFVIGYINL